MRRRPRDPNVSTALDTFHPADWPAADVLDAFKLWRAARAVHAERHGWTGGPVAQLMGESDVRAALTGGRLLPFDRTPEELEVIADRLGRMYGRRPMILRPRSR